MIPGFLVRVMRLRLTVNKIKLTGYSQYIYINPFI